MLIRSACSPWLCPFTGSICTQTTIRQTEKLFFSPNFRCLYRYTYVSHSSYVRHRIVCEYHTYAWTINALETFRVSINVLFLNIVTFESFVRNHCRNQSQKQNEKQLFINSYYFSYKPFLQRSNCKS